MYLDFTLTMLRFVQKIKAKLLNKNVSLVLLLNSPCKFAVYFYILTFYIFQKYKKIFCKTKQ